MIPKTPFLVEKLLFYSSDWHGKNKEEKTSPVPRLPGRQSGNAERGAVCSLQQAVRAHTQVSSWLGFYCPPISYFCVTHNLINLFFFGSDSDCLRICFKFEEENAEKDTEAVKKERFGAVMGMMQVSQESNSTKLSILSSTECWLLEF